MNLVDVSALTRAEFHALDVRLKRLKEAGRLPPIQLEPETLTPYIKLDRRCYPIEAMFEREVAERDVKLRLARGRLLIRPIQEPSRSRVVVVTAAQSAIRYGKVIGVGPATTVRRREVTAPCAVGDLVVYSMGHHHETKLQGERYVVIRFEDVLVKLKS